MDELENLRKQLEELKALRDRLAVDEVKEEEKVEEKVEEETTDLRSNLEKELEAIGKEIEELEEEVKRTAKEYDESYKRLQAIIDEYENRVGDTKLLSEEELEELRKTTENLKVEENERSIEIKRRLDAQKKIIRELKSKRTRIEKDLVNAEALGLSYDEYKDITSTIRKTSIMNGILEEKGLSDIISKKAKERTKEENELLKKAKEEILAEISEFKANPEYDDYSVLDIIEALYSLDTKYIRVEAPREIKTPSKELMIIDENKETLPFKVVNPNFKPANEVVQEAPKDMENAQENEKVDINELKPAEEKVTLFKDTDTEDYYVRKYAVDRFKLKSADIGNEVRINGSLCYKISEADVNRIKENANNAFSPYIADVKEITLEKEKAPIIAPEDTKDELIPGTNIKRPRDRGIDETDEEYEAFLKSYYDKVFPKKVEENVKEITPEEVEETVNKEEKSLMVIPQPEEKTTEPIEEYETIDEPVTIEIDPNSGITVDFNEDELTTEDITNVIKEELEKEELTDEDITGVVEEELDKDELTDDAIVSVVDEELGKINKPEEKEEEEELTDEDIKDAIEELTDEEKQQREKIMKEIYESIEKQKAQAEAEVARLQSEFDEELAKDKYRAKNIQAKEEFKEELKKGNVLYNIVHTVPKIVKAVANKVKELFEPDHRFDDVDEMNIAVADSRVR